MIEQILNIQNLSKSYGSIKALNQLNLTVNRGEIFGILGPNGSGKTTTLGIILGVTLPNSGSCTWFGEKPSAYLRTRIGAVLEQPNFYPHLTARQNLRVVARIKGVPHSDIMRVLAIVGLEHRADHRFKTFSYGMKQRLAIGAALLGDPQVLILDEPTNGLDPQGIAEIRELVIRIASRGITIIMASHLLDEVQKVCTNVAVLRTGKLIYTGPVDDMVGETTRLELVAPDMTALHAAISELDGLNEITVTGGRLVANFNHKVDPAAVNKALAEKGIYLSHLARQHRSLESQFLELLSNPEKTKA